MQPAFTGARSRIPDPCPDTCEEHGAFESPMPPPETAAAGEWRGAATGKAPGSGR